MFENYNGDTGKGQRGYPFDGWTGATFLALCSEIFEWMNFNILILNSNTTLMRESKLNFIYSYLPHSISRSTSLRNNKTSVKHFRN